MRILCLHDINSSAPLLLDQINEFAKKLDDKHNIELAFVNSPLIVSNDASTSLTADTSNSNDGSGNSINNPNKEDTSYNIKRTWYYKNASNNDDTIGTSTCTDSSNCATHDKKFIGLDASIISLSQIWNQSLYSNPFHGILGIGQGAALASLLPLLEKEQSMSLDCDDVRNDGGDNDDYDWNDRDMMFEGIKFCIFFNGYDLLNDQGAVNVDGNGDDTDGTCNTKANQKDNLDYHYYGEVQDIPSLHIISSIEPKSEPGINRIPSSENQKRSIELFQHYGGCHPSSNAQVKYIQSESVSLNNSNRTSVYNVIGRFLVHQKKAIYKKKHKNETTQRGQQNQENEQNQMVVHSNNSNHNDGGKNLLKNKSTEKNDSNTEDEIAVMIEKAQMKLAIVEEKAHSIIASTVALNPPKSLMAIITPDASSNCDDSNNTGSSHDNTLVGGWTGHKDAFRSEGFKQSGGAPCPKEFVLKQQERLK